MNINRPVLSRAGRFFIFRFKIDFYSIDFNRYKTGNSARKNGEASWGFRPNRGLPSSGGRYLNQS